MWVVCFCVHEKKRKEIPSVLTCMTNERCVLLDGHGPSIRPPARSLAFSCCCCCCWCVFVIAAKTGSSEAAPSSSFLKFSLCSSTLILRLRLLDDECYHTQTPFFVHITRAPLNSSDGQAGGERESGSSPSVRLRNSVSWIKTCQNDPLLLTRTIFFS